MAKAGSSIAQSHWPEQSLAWFSQCKPDDHEKKKKDDAKTQAVATDAQSAPTSRSLVLQATETETGTTAHEVLAYFEADPDVFYDEGTRDDGEIIGIIGPPDELGGENCSISGWNLYSLDDFLAGGSALKTVTEDYRVQASDPESIVLTPIASSNGSKHVNLWLNKAMTGFDKDVRIGSFDVYDGGYYYIAYTSLPDGISDEGFDVLYYGNNKDLVDREGVTLGGWVNSADNEADSIGFLPDDFIDYDELPDGDTIDLYAVWYDPLVYGLTYHANRSDSDDYQVESAEFSYDGSTLTIAGLGDDDEGLKNSGKKFLGWNTAADGSGEWFDTGEQATLEQLGFGTRAQYLQDLEGLAVLEVEETPTHYTEAYELESSEPYDELEAKLEAKYTRHLYAQWEDGSSKPTPQSGASKTPATGTAKAPATGDATMLGILAIVLIAIAALAVAIIARGKRRNPRR